MRIDVKKFLFVGSESHLEQFFRRAQEGGFVHFIDSIKNRTFDIPSEIKDTNDAIKILGTLTPTTQEAPYDGYHMGKVFVGEILEIKNRLDKNRDEDRTLGLDISRVEVFGQFNKQDIESLEKETGKKFQFFCAPADTIEDLPSELFFVDTRHNLDFFFALNSEPKSYDKLTEIHIEKPLGTLVLEKEKIEKKIASDEELLKSYAKYDQFLRNFFTLSLNDYQRIKTEKMVETPLEESLFSISGWVPASRMKDLEPLLHDTHVIADEIAIDETDSIPTYLENQGVSRVGEDLIHIYDTPSLRDKDPSLWVLIAFTVFFSMILGDGGYGIVLLALVGFLWYKFPGMRPGGKRFLKLCVILTCGTIVWGLLSNNFFGIPIPLDSPLRKVSLMNYLIEKKVAYHIQRKDAVYKEWTQKHPELKDAKTAKEFLSAVKEENGETSLDVTIQFSRSIMLELALLVGVIHIILSHVRVVKRKLDGIGWIIMMIGGFLYLPRFVHAATFMNYVFGFKEESTQYVGLYLLCIGFSVAVILAVFQHKLLGLIAPMEIIQMFADVLSYLRIYALGMAGAIMAETINHLAIGLPIYIAIVMLLFAHLCNIGLGVMGAVIHGLRLNFLEWYRYSFEGGGKKFNPLKFVNVD